MTTSDNVEKALGVLAEFGAVRRNASASSARNAILGCLGCKLSSDCESVTAPDIVDCSGLSNTFVYHTLRRFVRANVLTYDIKPTSGGHAKQEFTPSNTPVGEAIKEVLMLSPVCDNPVNMGA